MVKIGSREKMNTARDVLNKKELTRLGQKIEKNSVISNPTGLEALSG